MWIWQGQDWPNFTYDIRQLQPSLHRAIYLQGKLNGSSRAVDHGGLTLDAILANIIYSSDIEGEKLDARSVRSSLANHLGLTEEVTFPTDKHTEGVVESALDAINNLAAPLTLERLLKWHGLLFQREGLWHQVQPGCLRPGPVQVVSGRLDKPVVHFEAPPAQAIDREIERFILWFNTSQHDVLLDPILRAAIAHLWFLTLHPFEDGNGRIGRLIMDLALAQAENTTVRLYAMSQSINDQRKEYYHVLEHTQRGTLDITTWLVWFCDTLGNAIQHALDQIALTMAKVRYWAHFDQGMLKVEQAKVINRLLEGDFADGINNRQYMAVAKVSRATATRHLAELVEQNFLVAGNAGGRSARYRLNDV